MIQGGETAGVLRGTQNRLIEISQPDLAAQADFYRHALACGIELLLLDFGFAKPDPILLAAALGLDVEEIRFIVAYRSGLMSPVVFVQQLNTLSALIRGRSSLNIVAGHSPDEQRSYGDFLDHDRRYERTGEFLAICRAFWRGERDIDFEGRHYRIEELREFRTGYTPPITFAAGQRIDADDPAIVALEWPDSRLVPVADTRRVSQARDRAGGGR